MTPFKDRSSSFLLKEETRPLSFNSDCESMDDESSVVLHSPPRAYVSKTRGSASRLHSSRLTPRSRRLFDDDDDDDNDTLLEDASRRSSSSSTDQSQLFSPSTRNHATFTPRYPPTRRKTLKPLDLNNEMKCEPDATGSVVGDRAAPDASPDAATGTATTAAAASFPGRKRSSAERKAEEASPNPSRSFTMDNSSTGGSFYDDSSSSDQAMYASPGISPNSFLTMDGRFVQSKNPFSSPMVLEDASNTEAAHHNREAAGPGPSLPFFTGADSKPCLPPRHSNRTHQQHQHPSSPYASHTNKMSGFPDKRFSFTGSPIFETEDLQMESTDAASSGSLHKVRRLNLSDDVVAATGLHLSRRRRQHHQQQLSIDTSLAHTSHDPNDDPTAPCREISPTDVMSFPPPPTPQKQRLSTHSTAYASIRRMDPTTPHYNRRHRLAMRTPHRTNDYDDDDDDDPLRHHHHAPRGPSRALSSASSQHQTRQQQQPKSRFYGDFDVIGELGQGSFGTVFKVLSRLDGCMYAIKAAQRKARGRLDRESMLKEVYALAALSDQADTAAFHIVRYHQAWMEDDRLYIQTELCTGTLMDEMRRHQCLTEPRRFKLLREILLALEFIHKNNMVHLDIKPDNVFLKNDQYKLGDFGLVTKISAEQEVEEGDSRYMSMELLSGDRSDLTKSDIFSLGATLYEICLGRQLPMNGDEWQQIRAGTLQPLPPKTTSPDLTNIIHQMMNPTAAARPSAVELLKRPQLLSSEQKALIEEKSKVMQANLELAKQAQKFQKLSVDTTMDAPVRKGLTRANTWNGSSFPYL